MKREPSIHITETQLVECLKGVITKKVLYENKVVLAQKILEKVKTYSVASRSIYVSNDKLHKKTEKLKLAGRSNASMFAQILLLTRRKFKHRGIELIKVGDRYWLELKAVCKLATDFCNEFGIGMKEGYIKYCEMGLEKMKNYSLNKFLAVHAAICKTYESYLEIEQDDLPGATKSLIKYYLKKVNERIGWVSENYEKVPEKYACFIRARNQAKEIGIESSIFIDAQFDGLEWANAIPDPYQLYGDKAADRVMKYCYKNKIIIEKKVKRKVDFKKVKKNGNHHSK